MVRHNAWARASSSPLRLSAWQQAVAGFPDSRFAAWLIRGLSSGFRIGCAATKRSRAPRRILRSAALHPAAVDEFLSAEMAAGRVLGPLPDDAVEALWISPFEVIPKNTPPGQPQKWRLIVNLSAPRGRSVNDFIANESCSTEYVRVAEATQRCALLGEGAQLVKLDIQSAYRVVPVHPADRHFLGVRWQGQAFADTALPFGLRSAPIIFSAVADALLWVMYQRGISSGLHYLDDYLFFGRPRSREGAANKSVALTTCEALGMPVAAHKVEGPTTQLLH